MTLVIVSTFWNSEKYIEECINSIKSQYYTNFKAYFIDDMSTDSSYEVAKKTIGDDRRFTLIKNTEKKYKCKNFIDVIRDNSSIKWNDVIVEIDGDDKLINNHVFGQLTKIYMNKDIWVCGSKWVDKDGNSMNYGRMNADFARTSTWNFSHLRTYRAFLFRLIKDEHLMYNGDYLKAAVDIGIGLPILEMSGNEHYYFLDEVTYEYHWHDKQSYSKKGAIKDGNLQRNTAKHIYSLPKYEKLSINYLDDTPVVAKLSTDKTSMELVNEVLLQINDKPFNPGRVSEVDYNSVNKVINKNKKLETAKPVIQNKPINRNQTLQLKRDSLVAQARKMQSIKPNGQNMTPHVFGGRTRQ